MTEKKRVSSVSRLRMYRGALSKLRTIEMLANELEDTKDKLHDEGFSVWMPGIGDKAYRSLEENIERCLIEIGKCIEENALGDKE